MGFYQLAIAYKAAAKYKDAIECLKEILKEDPNIVSAHYHLGRSYLGLSEVDKAVEEFEKVVNLDPEHKDAARRLKELTDSEDLYTFKVPSLQ
ncbi:MAG: tetratricopeptide repeat protein [Candidatus Cloacimonetes bacterium]|nr:tetratricopeptide repeat protein [Candidatus Cloacimonadota bacterium]